LGGLGLQQGVQQRLVTLQAGAGVGGGVDLDQLADADPGVDLGRLQALVAEQRRREAYPAAAAAFGAQSSPRSLTGCHP